MRGRAPHVLEVAARRSVDDTIKNVDALHYVDLRSTDYQRAYPRPQISEDPAQLLTRRARVFLTDGKFDIYTLLERIASGPPQTSEPHGVFPSTDLGCDHRGRGRLARYF